MTHRERFRLATEVRQRKAAARASYAASLLREGRMPVGRIAFYAGVSDRTLRRYRKMEGL